MEKNGTLVVVDMQPCFYASNNEKVLQNVVCQCLLARKYNWGIVILEYEGRGKAWKTHFQITKSLEGYKKVVVKRKLESDGSLKVRKACQENQFCMTHFRICGVNTLACVIETVEGLQRLFKRSTLEVMRNACNDSYFCDNSIWKQFPRKVILRPPLRVKVKA